MDSEFVARHWLYKIDSTYKHASCDLDLPQGQGHLLFLLLLWFPYNPVTQKWNVYMDKKETSPQININK